MEIDIKSIKINFVAELYKNYKNIIKNNLPIYQIKIRWYVGLVPVSEKEIMF